MKQRAKRDIVNLIAASCCFGAITGVLTAMVITVYKVCAKYIVSVSKVGYTFLRGHLIWLPLVFAALFGIAALFVYCYHKIPNLRGGGIPTSIGILRGIVAFSRDGYLLELTGWTKGSQAS